MIKFEKSAYAETCKCCGSKEDVQSLVVGYGGGMTDSIATPLCKTCRHQLFYVLKGQIYGGAGVCWHCGGKTIWGSDFSYEDYGYDGDGIVSNLSCSWCGADIEVRVPLYQEGDNDDNANEDQEIGGNGMRILLPNTLLFAKVRPTAKIPTKDIENAGYDVYADFEEDYRVIGPHKTEMIPTGICSAMSDHYCGILKERGSTGTKGMAQRSGVIDSGYRGEWFVPITNTTDKYLIIGKAGAENYFEHEMHGFIFYPYEKAIAQMIIVPVPEMESKEATIDEIKAIPSKRGDGALGASGK